MRADRWPGLFVPLLVLAGLTAVGPPAAAASPVVPPQETSPAEPQAAPEAAPPAPEDPASTDERSSVADRTAAELSDAERLLRMQQVVTSDVAKLERLRTDLESRKTFVDRLTGRMAEFQAVWEEMQARLEELEPESEEASTLEGDIARLEREYERHNRHASLTLEAEGALRTQISDLAKKIETDRRGLAEFRFQAPQPAAPEAGAEAPRAPAEPATSASSPPGFSLVPGLPASRPSAPPAETPRVLPETPEQIAARKELEKKRSVAEAAEAAVVTFVERKEALEGQIDLERTLLRVDGEALENLTGYLGEREEWLEAGLTTFVPGAVQPDPGVQNERLQAEIERAGAEVERRRADLASLEDRLQYVAAEQQRVTEYAEERRREAEAARKWLVWIESPLYPANVARWAVERGPRVLAVLLVAGFVLLLLRVSLRRIARLVVTQSRKARSTAVNRADTLSLSFQSLATTLILAACVLLVLQEAGLDVKTVLGGAAILGVAIAFGAQNLMRDYFTGFMMLLEDQYELGDLITIGSITGTVERVNMRVTVLRDLEGRVHFIPNGQIGSLTNRTYDWARALVEIPVGPAEDVDQVMALLVEVAGTLKTDPEWSDEIVDDPQMLGVDKFTESGVIIKLMLKTHPERMFPVRRELLRRVKKAFDAAGIEPGFPVRVVRQLPTPED